tara:strand:+ start:260 stop:1837 length:1578 start_codon:yes stop_codon:yes gene_type:complete
MAVNSPVIIDGKNEEAFRAVLNAFAKATDSDIVPMSALELADKDSIETVQIAAKIHVPKAKRLQVRDDAAGYLNYYMQQDPGLGVEVITGTAKKPDKEKLDFVIRQEGKKKQLIRIEIKPTNVGGSGGGSAATTIQETALATFLAMRYDKGSDLECHPTNTKNCITTADYRKGLAQVDHNNKVKVEEIMALESDWIQSCIKGANKIANTIKGSGWTYVRGDTRIDDGAIKKAFLRVKKKKGSKAPVNEDKWNPADIWMVQDGKQNEIIEHLNKEGTIDCLNNYISLAFSETKKPNNSGKDVSPRSLIGISLKKLGPTVRLDIMNKPNATQMDKAQKVRFIKNKTTAQLTSFSAMDVYLMYSPSATTKKDSFQCRNFAGQHSGDWKLELKGEYAAQGKIQGQVMRDLINAAADANGFGSNVPNEPAFNDCKPNAAAQKKTAITNEIYKLLKKYRAKDFSIKTADAEEMKRKIEGQDASWRYSKLSGLRLLDWLFSLTQTNANRVLKEMYLYASSQTEKSSTYYKLH